MNKFMSFVMIFGALICSSQAPAATTINAKEALAVTAATTWLEKLDKKDYKESWEEAASLFKAKVTSREWVKTVAAVREPFGPLVSRKLKAKVYTTSIPGVDEGEYVVIQFDAQYKNRKSVVETVTPMLDDGQWRVSGYYAK